MSSEHIYFGVYLLVGFCVALYLRREEPLPLIIWLSVILLWPLVILYYPLYKFRI